MSSNLESSFPVEDENAEVAEDDVKVASNTFIPCQQLPELTGSIGPGLLKCLLLREVQPENGVLRRTSPIFRPVTFLVEFGVVLVEFGVVLVAFGVVSVAPLTGWCVTVAYESRAR